VRTPRLGFVGVGWIGRMRMEALLKAGAAEAAAVYDASPEAVREAVKVAPGAYAASSFDDLLARDLDGVVIATPNALHAEQSTKALARGMAVFCQKPLGRDAAEVRAILRAAEKADRPLGVDLSYRHTATMRRIKEMLDQRAIGDVFAAELVFHNAYGPDKGWFYDRKLSGGGCMLDLGIHLVDLALWALAPAKVENVSSRLFAKGQPLGEEDVEDYAIARLDLSTGAAVQVACSWRVSAGCDAVIGATFHGTQGSLRMSNVNGSFYDFRADHLQGTKLTPLVSPPDDWGGRALLAWAQDVGRGATFDRGSWGHAEVAETLDRVYGR